MAFPFLPRAQRGTGPGGPLSGYLSPGLAHLCVPAACPKVNALTTSSKRLSERIFKGFGGEQTLLWKFTTKLGVLGPRVSLTKIHVKVLTPRTVDRDLI